ncbi:MAG: hypothetical protein KGL25_01890 [Gammaproteobacteria bacterium]|nr:hypothetical protein [Gammaproteobacteria bacterium]MDE2250144.1 hypothetical protein [Gammaproteobacteria bacterium]
MAITIELIGWLGAALILLAYILLSLGRIDGRSRIYQLINVLGSAGVLVNSGYNRALPSAALNLIWLAMGTYVLLQQRRTR